MDCIVAERTAKSRHYPVAPVGYDSDIEISTYPVGLRAICDERIERFVKHVSEELSLRSPTLHLLIHRSGLINSKQQASRVLATNLTGVRHGCPSQGNAYRSEIVAARVPSSKKSTIGCSDAL